MGHERPAPRQDPRVGGGEAAVGHERVGWGTRVRMGKASPPCAAPREARERQMGETPDEPSGREERFYGGLLG